jgi:hypothetical protein
VWAAPPPPAAVTTQYGILPPPPRSRQQQDYKKSSRGSHSPLLDHFADITINNEILRNRGRERDKTKIISLADRSTDSRTRRRRGKVLS